MNKELSGIEIVVLVVGGGALLLAAGPALASTLMKQAATFLIQWSVLVPQSQALIVVPGTGAGLDGARVCVVVGLVVMSAVGVRRWSRTRGQEQ